VTTGCGIAVSSRARSTATGRPDPAAGRQEEQGSQLPGTDGKRLASILDEGDLLPHRYGNEGHFRDPAAAAR